MKIKSLLFSLLAIFTFASCDSNDDATNAGNSQPSELKVVVKIPGLNKNTRGFIEAPVEDYTPVITSATVYVQKTDGNVIESKNITFTEGKFNEAQIVTFEAIPLSGSEKVTVSANVTSTDAGKSEVVVLGREVKDIQPSTTNTGIKNVYYMGEASIATSALPGNSDGHKVYEATVDVKALAARVEITDNIKFNKDLVKDLLVDVVTPTNYVNTYGATTKFTPSTNNQGALWLSLTSDNYNTDIMTGGKAIANHIFAGDEQRIAFRIKTTNYEYEKSEDGKGRKVILKKEDGSEYESYIYKATDNKLYVKKDDDKFYECTYNNEGKPIVNTDASTTITSTDNIQTKDNSGFFTMVKFRKLTDNAEVHQGKYEGGFIYKIKFSEIDWNGDGQITDEDAYNPDENGGGTTEPAETADLIVIATIVEWTPENVFPGIE